MYGNLIFSLMLNISDLLYIFICLCSCLLHVLVVVGSGENGNEVLYGTSDGRVGLVQIGKYDLCISP